MDKKFVLINSSIIDGPLKSISDSNLKKKETSGTIKCGSGSSLSNTSPKEKAYQGLIPRECPSQTVACWAWEGM